ncbi:MAG: aminoacyl-tRNA hydrolase [Ruminococcaceae bacterium]|nr:aminoacyl-tRNA hydrolase [Oscillospiraceae bacterium]
MYIIVGIGNPGKKYESTRHNIGFIAIDYMASLFDIKVNKIKHKALIGEGKIDGERVMLVKPQTFVNLSGESVREIADYYKVSSQNIIVIYDDVSLEEGSVRIRKKGSDGGHNGIKSIIYQLSSDAFPRIKLGVGSKPPGYDLKDWVLAKFTDEDIKIMSKAVETAAKAVPEIIKNGAESAMNKYNSGGGKACKIN